MEGVKKMAVIEAPEGRIDVISRVLAESSENHGFFQGMRAEEVQRWRERMAENLDHHFSSQSASEGSDNQG